MNEQLDEAHKLNDTVIMSYPSLKGVKGTIGEIRHAAYKGGPKTYTIDYQHPKHSAKHTSSIQLSSTQFKAHKEGNLGEETLDEVSKKTLGSYVKAAAKDAEDAGKDQEHYGDKSDYARGEKRQKGISKAIDRLTKEEVESVDELSMDTVKSYKAKVATNPAPSKTTSDILHKAIRRFAGKERAEDRIHHDEMVKMRARLGIKEETLDEGTTHYSAKSGSNTYHLAVTKDGASVTNQHGVVLHPSSIYGKANGHEAAENVHNTVVTNLRRGTKSGKDTAENALKKFSHFNWESQNSTNEEVLDEGLRSKLTAGLAAGAIATGSSAYMPTSVYTQNHTKNLTPITQVERDKINSDAPWTAYRKMKALKKANAEADIERQKNYHKHPAIKEEILDEASDSELNSHKVMVTVSDPNHTAVSKRKDQVLKRVVVKALGRDEAKVKAEAFYKKQGYKVHDVEYHSRVPMSTLSTMKEEVLDEASSLYKKAIDQYAKRHADNYMGGGNEYLYKSNKFDHGLHGISKQKAGADYDKLFAKHVKKLNEEVALEGFSDSRLVNLPGSNRDRSVSVERKLSPEEKKKQYDDWVKAGEAKAKKSKLREEVLDEASFADTMKKAIASHTRGDSKLTKYHLDNAKTARYTLPSTAIAKNKTMLDKYSELSKLYEETLDEAAPSHKVGDTVWATSPTNKALTMTGKVTKIGQTLTTVKHKDGSEAHYPHKNVAKEYSDLHKDPAKKYKQFQREHLEQTGELLTLTEVKYMAENANGGAGSIAQHAGINGEPPEGTGKVKKMMGNKASVDAIVKIIAKGAKPN